MYLTNDQYKFITVSFLFPPHPVESLVLPSVTKRTIASSLVMMLVLSVAFTSLFSATTERTGAAHSECSDGRDNDSDSKVDYPQDDDCETLDDSFEGVGTSGNFITVTDGKETISPSGSVVYIITLKQQRDTSRTVNIQMHLPHQSNIVSASDGGSVSPDFIRWTNVSLYKNTTRTLQVHSNVSPDAKVGQFLVTRVLVDGAEATDTTLVENYVPQPSDIYQVSVSDGKEYIKPGQNLTYTVRVRNTSSKSATNDVRLNFPSTTYFISSSDGSRRDSYNVVWPNVTLAGGEQRLFTATVQIDPAARDRQTISARANVGAANATDQTVIMVGLPYNSISTSISDNRSTAEVGQLLTYTVKVTNNDPDVLGTNIALSAGLPMYGQFEDATGGGYYDGSNVRWLVMELAPKQTRSLTFSVRIRPDAPLGAILSASAVSDGITGAMSRDTTKIVSVSSGDTSSSVFFRKVSDRGEAFPGGRIRYTLTVRNTLDHAITDAAIFDRYDGQYLSLETFDRPQDLASQSDGNMKWTVPVLQPGESWQTTYVLSVAENTPAGVDLDNVATIRGSDLDELSLSEKVRTVSADVMRDFPETGGAMDAILGLILAFGAFGATATQRRLGLGNLI